MSYGKHNIHFLDSTGLRSIFCIAYLKLFLLKLIFFEFPLSIYTPKD